MKLLYLIAIFFFSSHLFSEELRIAVIGEPEELRLKVEAALFQSPYCKVIELKKRKETLNEIKLGQMGILDEEKVARAGKLLGAEKFLTIHQKGEFNSLRLIDVETSTVEGAWVSNTKAERTENGLKMDTASDYSELINKMLEGLAVKKALATLTKSNISKIQVKIKFPKSKFKIGESLKFEVISSEDGYLTLIDIQPDGSVVQLLPNKSGQSNQIKSGDPFRFPSDNFLLKVSPPWGRDTIKAIVTKNPLVIFQKSDLNNDMFSTIKPGQGLQATKGISMAIQNVPAGDWGMDELSFETME